MSDSEKAKTSKSKLLLIVMFLVVFGGFLWTGYSYYDARQQLSFFKTPEGQVEANRQLVTETIEAVGKLMILPPGDEEPVVLIIQNAAELANQQAFYTNATDGDRLIIYSTQAIIYSPERNIIVNVGPVVRENTGNEQVTPPPPEPVENPIENNNPAEENSGENL